MCQQTVIGNVSFWQRWRSGNGGVLAEVFWLCCSGSGVLVAVAFWWRWRSGSVGVVLCCAVLS
jgi:hypothetical protein